MTQSPSRRKFIHTLTTGAATACAISPIWEIFAVHAFNSRFNIGVCDWSIGHSCSPQALLEAKALHLDGVQVSVVNDQNQVYLKDKDVQAAYKKIMQTQGITIGGLAIGRLNQVPFKSEPETIDWVYTSIQLAQKLGIAVVLLAFFGKGDINGDTKGIKEVISRLKKLAPEAEKANVVLGLESWLSAKSHMDIIESVGSDHVQVYYDVANSHKMGYDIYEEIRWLGKTHICEFHLKENGYLLGKGLIDFIEVKKAIDDIEYEGWVVIEGAKPDDMQLKAAYQHNSQYVRKLFT